MRIEIADKAGFCFGVKRAIELAEKAAAQYGEAYTLGELIHNEIVIDDLARKGIRAVETVAEAAGKPLVIRSHGVSRALAEEAAETAGVVIDAACPFVKEIHKKAAAVPKNGTLIILGNKDHPEVMGIIGNADCRAFTAMTMEDIDRIFAEENLSGNVEMVVQTTFDSSVFSEISQEVKEKYPCLKIHNTICTATAQRQKSARELAARADLMIVVGGRSSSNTRKLVEICEACCETVFVTTADELAAKIPSRFTKEPQADILIGITAGASTPAYTIKEVHGRMNEEITKTNENEEDFASLLEQDQSFNRLYTGKRVKATVVSVSKKEAVVEVGAKQTGYILREELTNDPTAEVEDIVKEGDVIDAVVVKVDDSVGTAMLSKKRVDAQVGLEKLEEVKESGAAIEGKVSQIVKGGVIVLYENTRVFIPASHTGVPRGGKLEDLQGKVVKFKIIEVSNERGGRVVGSIRQATREVRDAERTKFWEEIEVGQKFEGEVRSIESYGVFVDIGPVDGLVHTADLTWNRVGHPKDIVNIGDKINVIVKSFDQEKKRVSLSAKDPDENPWNKFMADYAKGDVIKATIVSITEFGAFAQIIPGVDGLIHISQISTERVADIHTVLKIGDVIDLKIIDIDEEKNRVSLSIRALSEAAPDDEGEEESEAETADED